MTESRIEEQSDGFERPRSLKRRALLGSAWTLSSHLASQFLRLGSNLLLTRLLFPEAFGLMALVQTFMIGLEMFSDVGIRPSIIQSKRGSDPAFLNTAWTIQAGRGCGLWLCACLIAFPAAKFYSEPMLMQLLPVVGLTSLISGLNSTKLATSNRQLDMARLTMLELGSQIVSLIVMLVGAWMFRSVWALVVGGLVGSFLSMVLSHTMLQGENNRFHWDSDAFRELHHFGRWIFLSTVLTFIASQGATLVMPQLMGLRFLGIFKNAQTLSQMSSEVLNSVGDRVLFPSYSELVRERPERLYRALRRSRIVMLAMSWCTSLFFILFGKQLIDLLYDSRYTDAGWMLQILALGSLVGMVGHTYNNVLLARGQSRTISVLLVVEIGVRFTAMFLGNYFGGQQGVIIGLASVGWLMYPALAICYIRISMWQPEVDLPVIAAATGITTVVLFHQHLIPVP
ncbi:oligosaccharide flippase family protein [Leptolyngbya sp. FACHB-36]|nr:oligosaccharide flippase family protein [Leptolyngbya sp. FACHB-36]